MFGGARRDAVYLITLAAPSDVLITVTPPTTGFSQTFVSFRNSPCGATTSERRCLTGSGTTPVQISQRALAAGTYWVIVESSTDSDLRVRADVTTPPAPRPTEDRCPATEPNPAVELNDGMPHVATLVSLEDDYVLSCSPVFGTAVRRDGVFRLTTTAVQDVRITATAGAGTVYLSWRNAPCALGSSERRCLSGFAGSSSLLERSLPAGTYWVVVEHSTDAPVTVTAMLTPPAPVTTYALSMSPAGVSWIDVCSMAGSSRVLMSVDDANVAIPMTVTTFPLRMYGVAITTVLTVSSNGWMSLNPGATGALSGILPDPSTPNLTLAPAWTDQLTGTEGV
jgi:hypothetical protein